MALDTPKITIAWHTARLGGTKWWSADYGEPSCYHRYHETKKRHFTSSCWIQNGATAILCIALFRLGVLITLDASKMNPHAPQCFIDIISLWYWLNVFNITGTEPSCTIIRRFAGTLLGCLYTLQQCEQTRLAASSAKSLPDFTPLKHQVQLTEKIRPSASCTDLIHHISSMKGDVDVKICQTLIESIEIDWKRYRALLDVHQNVT